MIAALKKCGDFKSWEDLQSRVKGVGAKTVDILANQTSPVVFLNRTHVYCNSALVKCSYESFFCDVSCQMAKRGIGK